MTSEKICADDAHQRAGLDCYAQVIADYLIRYGDPEDGSCQATVRLIEGCRYDIHDVVDALRNQFPASTVIEVRDEEFLHEMHINIDWSASKDEWDDHLGEFYMRVICILGDLI